MKVQTGIERRASQLAAAADRNLSRIEVDRMSQEFADRHARLHVKSAAKVEPPDPPPQRTLAEGIAPVNVDNVPAVCVERADGELVPKQPEIAASEIEERADGRVGLAIVVAEVALEVPL